MITYGALILIVIVTLVFYFFNPKKYLWWEFFVPIVLTALIIIGMKALISHSNIMFTEYWGETITTAIEEEPYNYWHHQTCSYTTCTGSGKNQHCTTHYYDCSHEDHVGPKWWVKTNMGNSTSISEKQHDSIIKLFGSNRIIIKTRSNYDASDYCQYSNGTKFQGKRVGKISKNYSCSWKGTDETRRGVFSQNSYENKIKASDLSLFNIKAVTEEEADSFKLYKYPSVKDPLEFPTILGNNISPKTQELFKKLNAKFGPSNKLRLWILIFDNKSMNIATMQENYWVKGNKNELVICLGRKGQELQWAYSFSWSLSGDLTARVTQAALNLYSLKVETKNGKKNYLAIPLLGSIKPVLKDSINIDTSSISSLIPININSKDIIKVTKSPYPVLTEETWENYYKFLNANLSDFQKRSFKEFDYLTIELKTWQIILIYIIALILSVGINLWATNNEFEEEDKGDNKNFKKYKNGNYY
ncbi:MAG: hypothetical protein PHF86_01460 [Candidatus Nanoarchaeia archaeon]|nr:hypothetical protein [Candidatus Nanoarchaeia archaeon]